MDMIVSPLHSVVETEVTPQQPVVRIMQYNDLVEW